MVFDEKKNHRIPEIFAVGIPIPLYSMLFERKNKYS